jgi:hypothetical protein
MNAILLSSLLFVNAADPQPTPLLPVGKETTVVTEPIDKNGFIDFESAVNDRLGKGITPDTNANVLLWKAMGPKPEGGNGMPPEFFKRLGIDEPPAEGEYFLGLHSYMKDVLLLELKDFQAIFAHQSLAMARPWNAKDYPEIHLWLKANEKPLAIVHDAVKRPAYFNPLVSNRKDGDPSSLISCLLPGVQKCREIAAALTCRAMLRLTEGKTEAAWEDLVACHRLARHVEKGGTLIESLVGIAIHSIASNATITFIAHANLDSKQLLERLKVIQTLPAFGTAASKIDLGERFMFIDSVQMIRSGRFANVKNQAKPEDLKALGLIDWEPALRNGNMQYDRMVAALRIRNRAEREPALDRIEKELDEIAKKKRNLNDLDEIVKAANTGKAVGKEIGDVLISLLVPAIRKVQGAYERAEQIEANLHIAVALAAYHKDNKNYPKTLAELSPKYLATVPNDVFSGKPLIYKPNGTGYFFYSVGLNGKDDEGRWHDDTPPGDDPRVRMPLPEPKKP